MAFDITDLANAYAGNSISTTVDPPELPAYFMAADNHNYGNGNFAFTDPSTWEDGIGNVGKFILASAYSGVNSFYNTGIAVGNFFGADLEENDTAAALSNLDDDLGSYYKENQGAIDLAGFVTTSFIPGLAGVKLLNAGQKALSVAARTGILGENVGKAIGLLKPAAVFTQDAAKEIAATQASFSLINGNVIKALAAGAGQQALEGAIFETAVAATMFKNPVLEDQDGFDIASNILLGAGVGGVIGGAFSGAKTIGSIKKFVKEADIEEKSRTLITGSYSASKASEKIVQAYADLANTAPIPAGLEGVELSKVTRQTNGRIDRLNNEIRSSIHEMIPEKDSAFGNQLADLLKGMDAKQIEASLTYATQIGKVGTKLDAEEVLSKIAKKSYPEGASPSVDIQYVKLIGENAGDITARQSAKPSVLSIGDLTKNLDEANRLISDYAFTTGKLWNPITAASHTEAEARFVWADNLKSKIKDGTKAHIYDIPLQEAIAAKWQRQYKGLQELEKKGTPDVLQKINIVDDTGAVTTFTNPDDFTRSLRRSKQELALQLQKEKNLSVPEIAKIANVKQSYLAGQVSRNEIDDIFARQFYQNQYTKTLVDKGLRKEADGPVADFWAKPTYAKISYDTTPIQGADGQLLSGMAYIKAKQKLYQQSIKNVAAKQMGSLIDRFPDIAEDKIRAANRFGGGPSTIASAQGNYGSLEADIQAIGAATADLQVTTKSATRDAMTAPLYKLGQNQEAAIEFDAVNNLVASTAEHYVLNDTGDALVARSIKQYQDAIRAGQKGLKEPIIQEGAPEIILLKNQETRDAIASHISVNGKRVTNFKEIRAAQGLEDTKDATTFYPIRPNPKDYKYYAIVTDDSIASGAAGHKSMIHAASERELEGMIDRVPSNFRVRTGQELKDWFKANGEFEYQSTLHENYIDASLKRAGVNNQFFQKTNPQKIVDDILQHHLQADDIYSRELVNALYEKEFTELRTLGEQYSNISTSVYQGSYRFYEDTGKNPYLSYVKTALNINQASQNKYLYGFNQLVDGFVSKTLQPITDTLKNAKTPAELDKINEALQKVGAKSAYYDAATNLLANHSAPKGALSQFVRRANGILSTLTLGFDPLNAINNAVGATVLLGAETRSLIRAINAGSTEAAGELANLTKIQLPGMPDSITAPGKLIGNAYKRFFADDGTLKAFYEKNGWITSLNKQISGVHDDLTLNGAESVKDLDSKLAKAFIKAKELAEKGRMWSGNKYAEEMNRFVAADVMKQLTDVAQRHGLITEQESIGYINSFVNRTQGTFLASQRPLMFQGAIGQAVGLFQTYQFNLMQQLFRYVGEGTAKDAGLLLGLQGTVYGLNGLPAFNYINTHIVGTASGNPDHTDLYSSTYGVFGKSVGDLLLYGLPSNLLHANLYSRGDINPRQVTIIPTNPADIPIVNAFTGVLKNIKNMSTRIANDGSVWQTFLQGVEHNGLSRPLAGLAQVAQGFNGGYAVATSSNGNILGSNDILSISTIARLAGGRPIDEAIANDATYRTSVYKAVDSQRKANLREAVATEVIGGKLPDYQTYSEFAARYAATGGDQKRFNKYMLEQITAVNTPMANKITADLKSPYSQNMQRIMGGRDITDGFGVAGNQ